MPADYKAMYLSLIQAAGNAVTALEHKRTDRAAELLREGPVTVQMHDYGNFEKVGPLPTSLPENNEQITTEPGDIILYQGNSITVYYDENTWNFTRLGKVQGVTDEELRGILGEEDVEIIFSLNNV